MEIKNIYICITSAVGTSRLLYNWQLFRGTGKAMGLSLCAILGKEEVFNCCLQVI